MVSHATAPRSMFASIVRGRRSSFWIFLSVVGPGLIVASADNDAGGITTYSIAGAKFGFGLLWMLFLTTFSLAVTQEMGARMGIITGKGLGGLIRERFGVRWTAFAMLSLLVANFGSTAADIAGIAASMEIFGISRYITVPIAATGLFLLVCIYCGRGDGRHHGHVNPTCPPQLADLCARRIQIRGLLPSGGAAHGAAWCDRRVREIDGLV